MQAMNTCTRIGNSGPRIKVIAWENGWGIAPPATVLAFGRARAQVPLRLFPWRKNGGRTSIMLGSLLL